MAIAHCLKTKPSIYSWLTCVQIKFYIIRNKIIKISFTYFEFELYYWTEWNPLIIYFVVGFQVCIVGDGLKGNTELVKAIDVSIDF